MPKFTVACQWLMCAEIDIEANFLSEAVHKAYEDTELPKGASYVDDSFEVNKEVTEALNSTDEELSDDCAEGRCDCPT